MTLTYNGNPYDDLGGAEPLKKLVDVFYTLVAAHPELAPIFPDDLTETKEKQFKFLSQFLGGPDLYAREYGHPMLRARHMPFPITPKSAEAWLGCMDQALAQVGVTGPIREFLMNRLMQTAYHMVNRPPQD
ncbi:globin [Ammoniphilus oxalaticus]|uniref:Globin n=1 Tax=Ammoniphilus oxalaticus TaxID=66863 RepID=A0A419SQP9_9BACL|nr:globin [Ammoniphilus oxalaticus]RKD26820.1 globin [Ammoniphilus oxalaticus]